MSRALRLPVLLAVTPLRAALAFFVTLAREIKQALRCAWFDAVWELKEGVRWWRS
jgi:hypothetical protein